MGLREEKKQETRRGIVDTALALFRERGYDRTRVQDVVGRLRISEATFFNYFPTKRAVLEAAADDLVDKAVERLRRQAGAEDGSVVERLELLLRCFAESFGGDRGLASLVLGHTTYFTGDRTERVVEVHALLTTLLGEGQQRAELREDVPAARLAELYMAYIPAAVGAWVADGPTDEGLESRLLLGLTVFVEGAAVRDRAPVPA